MNSKQTCVCGVSTEEGADFCGKCGRSLTDKTTCPGCHRTVERDNFCPFCGFQLTSAEEQPQMRDGIWERGKTDFAAQVPPPLMEAAAKGGFEIRHGSKALFFEDGRLVEVAETGHHFGPQGGFFKRLFGRKRSLSAVLVDAGDVQLGFEISGLKTCDNLLLDIGMDVVLRLEDPNLFFINMMKERRVLTHRELRSMLSGEMQNALQEAVRAYDFGALSTDMAVKRELASRLEAHLRQSFRHQGLGFSQVRTLSIAHHILDESQRQAAETEARARDIESAATGKKRTAQAQRSAQQVEMQLRKESLDGRKEDLDITDAEKEMDIYGKERQGRRDIQERLLDAELIEKRLEVYERLKKARVGGIKSREELRKFRLEVDRDRVLDDTEWKRFEEEIHWQNRDRHRDRQFLIRKIELEQAYDIKRLQLVKDKELSVEGKLKQLELLGKDLEIENARLQGQLDHELRRAEAAVAVAKARAEGQAIEKEIARLSEKNVDYQTSLKDLELEKKRFGQELEAEKEKSTARHEISKLKTEENRIKAEMALSLLERSRAIKRKDERDKQLLELEKRREELDMQLKADGLRHEQQLQKQRESARIEHERLTLVSGLNIEQLIAISETSRADILGDLAQSQTLKGLAAEEIMALKDPATLAQAMEERARNTESRELKGLYERLLAQERTSRDELARVYQEGGERNERMFGQALDAMSGRIQQADESGKATADRLERFGGRALDNLGAAGGSGAEPASSKILLCPSCKREVKSSENFCPNCGAKMY